MIRGGQNPWTPRRFPAGFTLLETVLSMSVTALIMLAVVSAVVLAARAVPTPRGNAASTADAQDVASLLSNELLYATAVSELTPTAITFNVPDRDGDGLPETVRYHSPAAGGPLVRVHKGTEGVLIPAVASFTLGYDRLAVTATETVTETRAGGEMILASFVNYPSGTVTNKTINISSLSQAVQLFKLDPSALAANTTQVRITRLKLWLKGIAGGPGTSFAIYQAGAGGKGMQRYSAFTTIPSASLPSTYQWTDVPIYDAVVNDPGQYLCIWVQGTASAAGSNVQYLYNANGPSDTPTLYWTTDGGSTWQPSEGALNEQDMKFYVYGVCTSTTTEQLPVTRYYLRGVRISLAAGDDPAGHLDTCAPLLNKPEVPGP